MKRFSVLAVVVSLLLAHLGCKRHETVATPDPAPASNSVPSPAASLAKPPPPPVVPSSAAPALPTLPAASDLAVISTTAGDMVVSFWSDVAPNTVENFKKLARENFYNGTSFHRIIKGFMIQGGDPLTKDPSASRRYGSGGPGYNLNAEFNSKKHVRGVLSMARSQDPNSAGSQFFICLAPQPGLDNQYTAFGQVIRGDQVLAKIGDTPVTTNPDSGEPSVPLERIEIKGIRIVSSNDGK